MGRIFGVPVVEKEHSRLEEAGFWVGSPVAKAMGDKCITGHLKHPNFIGIGGDTGDMNFSVLETDEEQDEVGNQPERR